MAQEGEEPIEVRQHDIRDHIRWFPLLTFKDRKMQAAYLKNKRSIQGTVLKYISYAYMPGCLFYFVVVTNALRYQYLATFVICLCYVVSAQRRQTRNSAWYPLLNLAFLLYLFLALLIISKSQCMQIESSDNALSAQEVLVKGIYLGILCIQAIVISFDCRLSILLLFTWSVLCL